MIRMMLGFVAAVLSVLTFHQGMWAVLHGAGMMPPAYQLTKVPPLGVPLLVDLCFWGGVWGAGFGLILSSVTGRSPLWVLGLALGVAAALVGMFVVPTLKGHAPSGLPPLGVWERSLLINGSWGLGVGIILPLLLQAVSRRRAVI
ncbi:hypothetical protein ACOSOMT5_P2638 [Acidiphilium sp. MT5]|jgi:hypothetical protein